MIAIYVLLLNGLSDDPIFLITGVLLLVIAEIDRREFRIPDIFTKSALFALIIFFRTDASLLILTAGWIASMYLITYFIPHAFGRGDVKLIAVLILENGYFQSASHEVFLYSLISCASLLALPGVVAQRIKGRFSPYPFAPSIAAAWLVISVLGGA